MIRHLVILVVATVAQTVSGDTAYRLNTPIEPQSYAVAITPFFDTQDVNAFTFNGEVTINFQTESAVNQIKLHSEDLNFTASDVTVGIGNQNVLLNAASPLEFVKNYTFALVNLQSDLQVGITYTLKIVYRGPIRTDLSGFYRNYYYEQGVKKWLGATQMEPTHARKVFPCFDEPHLKATFTLTIDRPQSFQPTRANTKMQSAISLANGYIRETFYPTPVMSTYLVAFLISEFEAANYANNNSREFGIYTRPEAKNQTAYAFDIGQRVVEALSAYFGIDYYAVDSNLKLDHVALLDFRAGAMENWGLVTYREGLLLYVPEESTPHYKYRVAQIMAHETTHMWFGDLVTCHWWSNTWLNEGFANYFQDFITSLIEPDVGSGDILVTGSVYSAYDADSTPDSVPMTNLNVSSPSEISGHFGTITYQKAGSVIRMMHHLIGDEAFILGLNLYLNANKFKSGYPESMYAALNEGVTSAKALSAYAGANIADIMGSWVSQAGHPLLDVNVNYETDTVTLTQKRFYMNSSHASDEIYPIPITYTTRSALNFNNTKPAFIMTNRTHSFQIANLSHNWVIFNLQETGLYRVNYDDHSWQLIGEALKGDERESIHHLNRAKIVNDLFALYFSDTVSFSRLKDVLEFLEHETDYSVWNAAIRGLNKLRNYYLESDIQVEIENYIIKLTNNLITKLGYAPQSTEGTVALKNRMQVLDLACKVGHTGCTEYANHIFESFKNDGVAISPSLRPVAYCYGLRYGNKEDFEFLWKRMMETNVANEKSVIMDALGCTTDVEKLKKYLHSIEDEETVRTHDVTVPVGSVLSNYKNVQLVFKEFKDNFDVWSDKFSSSLSSVLTSMTSVLHTQENIDAFEEWLSSCSKCTEESVKAATTSLNTARGHVAWANAHKEEISTSLKNNAPMTSASMILVLFSLAAFLFEF